MCGIVGYVGKERAVPYLIEGLKRLEYRGYDSAGVAVLNKDTIDVVKDVGRVKNLESEPMLDLLNGTVGIAHTRWATHGKPSKVNAHPHLDNSKTFAVVHNGIIENYNEIKTLLQENGYTLFSTSDTEVIPNLISLNYKKCNDVLKAVSQTVKELQGSFALEVISPLIPDRIIIAKKDCPLVVGVGKNENYVASDMPAILEHTKSFYFIEDLEIGVIKSDSITFYDFDLNEKQKELKDVDLDAVASEKNGYDDYMLKEINEQSQVIKETIGTALDGDKITLPLDNIDFSKYDKIYIVACGTAMHAGIASKYAFEKYCRKNVIVEPASEFRYKDPIIDEHTLCIFISQSGETADTIAALKLAKQNKALTIAIVNVIGSSITRLADYTLYTHAGPEIAVASTKAYTCQIILLVLLALYIAQDLKTCDEEQIKKLENEIKLIPDKVKQELEDTEKIKKIARDIYVNSDVFFIGRLSDYATALEGSLKLKEISYIHSEAYPAGELKHGPIALIENGVPVIGIATNEKVIAKIISNLEEVVTRGAKVVFITNKDLSEYSSTLSEFSYIIDVPDCDDALSPIVSIVPLQLLAYYISKNKNLDVDKPRNLAKSVTVE